VRVRVLVFVLPYATPSLSGIRSTYLEPCIAGCRARSESSTTSKRVTCKAHLAFSTCEHNPTNLVRSAASSRCSPPGKLPITIVKASGAACTGIKRELGGEVDRNHQPCE